MSAPTIPHVLVIDDNPADIQLIELGFATNEIAVRLGRALDGVQAQKLLDELSAKGDCPRLILLDLNMPRANGFDVLRHLGDRQLCREANVVVMTTSNAPSDRERCLALGAKDFVTKPSQFDDLLELLKRLESYLRPVGA
jgi:CheY-like chemotaxis protein